MRAEGILNALRKKLGKRMKDAKIEKRADKARTSNVMSRIWLTVEAGALKEAVRRLCEIHPNPHISVISGHDLGKSLELIYHFSVNYGRRFGEISVSMRVDVPKKDPVVPTITDLIPGALISEREMQEMLGVKVDGIPDPRRLFLHPGFPRGVYPWRRDEKGPGRLVRDLNKGGKA